MEKLTIAERVRRLRASGLLPREIRPIIKEETGLDIPAKSIRRLSSKFRLKVGQCLRKKAYSTEAEAAEYTTKDNIELRIYQCPFCSKFHRTSHAPSTEDN